ncbi:MAG TPA: 2-hydroxyhepta-2,4-diene-1,7-dioate isomerase, partial [Gammaproteobacteria bacterium]|nr:2-hydroxyhepta-2,4-diene-1,7-dioate isomerase [Gammaproteobacteria bacterium]
MKLTSFSVAGRSSYGIVTDDGIIDLGALPKAPGSLRQALSQLGVDGLQALGHNLPADHALDDIVYQAPIVDPEKIICIGVNYVNRNKEYDDTALPPYPSVFMRTPGSLVGHLQPIVRPPESTQFDYEGEIGIVIGAAGRRISQE